MDSAKNKVKLCDIGKWSDEKYIKLFELHEENPMLWKKSDAQYMDINAKSRLYEEIGKQLDCTGEEAKLRFRSMKQTYQKNYKKLPKSGSAGGTQKEWRFTKNLSFLYNEMTKAGPIDNLGDDNTERVAESETFTDADTHYSSTSISSAEKPTTSFLNKRKREAATLQREQIYQGFLEELNKKDKYDEYGEGLASILRRIGKKDEAYAEELELKWHAEGIESLKCLSTRLASQERE